MNDKAKKSAKVALFASLIAVMILPFSGMQFAEAKDGQTIQDFKDEVKEWLLDTNEYKKSTSEKTDELKSKYDILLREKIEKIRIETDTKVLDESEILSAIDYISYETIKDEKIKIAQEKESKPKEINFLSWFGIQTVDAYCAPTTHPNYQQVELDIDGGWYGWYYNGDNDLYLILYSDNSVTCERTYTLSFLDEDHPYLDILYDQLRLDMYHRVHDVESFVIKNNNQIIFDDTWSSSNDYGCLEDIAFGCHDTTTLSYTPGQTIYVSNTWNHMMSISDTNPSLNKVLVP